MALQFGADALISNIERDFILKAIRADKRIDGRTPYDYRNIKFEFALDDSSCTVLLGHTRVMAVISASLETPYPDRPSEGSLRFNVEFSPMASPAFEPGRPGEDAVELARLVERGLRESRAVDLEALCVQAGRRVWHLRADVHVLDHCGNLADACGLAALGALCAFRRPDVTVNAGDEVNSVIVHSTDEKEPVSLTIHHLPLPVTFALFDSGDVLALDPSLKEEAAAAGTFTVTINPAGELCAVQKVRGVGISPAQTLRCIRIAHRKVAELAGQLRKALDAHEIARVQARIRRRTGTSGNNIGGAIGVTLLGSSDIIKPPPSSAAAGGGDGAALPAAVQRAMDLANGPDSSSSLDIDEDQVDGVSQPAGISEMEEEEEEEEKQRIEQQQREEDMDDVELPDDENPPVTAGTAEETRGEGKRKKKRRKLQNGGEGGKDEDRFATVSKLIAETGNKERPASDGGGDLKAAIKKKKKKASSSGRK